MSEREKVLELKLKKAHAYIEQLEAHIQNLQQPQKEEPYFYENGSMYLGRNESGAV